MNNLKFKGQLLLLLTAVSSIMFAQNQQIIVSENYSKPNEIIWIGDKTTSTTLIFQLNELNLTEVTTDYGLANKVESGKAPLILETGNPELFYLPGTIIIPDNGSSEIDITYGEFTDFENIEIVPSKGNLPRSINPDKVPYQKGEVYQKNEFFPGVLATLNEPFIMRDVRGQTVFVFPVQYNPITKILRVYSEITVTVNYTEEVGINEFINKKRNKTIDTQFNQIYQNLFLNHSEATRGYPTSEEGELLIICHTAFLTSMKPFVEWKRTIGRKTTIVPTSEIAPLNAENIKNYISNFYNNPEKNLAYVLLVGDATQIPTHTYTSSAADPPQVHTDHFYAQLEGNDKYLEILVGRMSAETVAHVQTQVQRTIWYERNITTSDTWLSVAAGLSANEEGYGPNHPGGHDGQENDYRHIDNIRDRLLTYGYNPVYQEYSYNCPGIPNTSNAQITSRFNSGVGMANYCNHGSINAWTFYGGVTYSNTQVNQLQNAGKLPFIFSVACLNGRFVGNTCFAETWMRATQSSQPTGAIATLMATISIGWQPPMTAQDEFVNICIGLPSQYPGTQPGTKRTFAGAALNATQKMLLRHGTSAANTTDFDAWLVFGDPTLMYRTKTPETMEISHLPILFLGMNSLTVECDTDGALAVLSYTDENEDVIILGTATVENGVAQFVLSEPILTPMELTLAITAFNKVTYIETIQTYPAESPFIVLQSFNLPENADFGKTIPLNFVLKNVSDEPFTSYNTIVNITTDNQYITLSKNIFEIGVIESNAVYISENELFATISENVPNNELVILNLTITGEYEEEEYEWTAKIQFYAYTAILDIEEIFIESANGVRIDRINPNQNNFVVVKFHNPGGAVLTDVNVAVSINSEFITIPVNSKKIDIIEKNGYAEARFAISASNSPAGTPVNMVVRASSGSFITDEIFYATIGNTTNYFMSHGTLTTAYANFYDSKGPNANYSKNENSTLVFNPKTVGKKLKISFRDFAVHNNDHLSIYDGSSVASGELLAQLTGSVIPPDYEATNETGSLTFVFRSLANSPTAPGWQAIIYEQENYFNISFDVKNENNEQITDAKIIFDGYQLAKNQFEVSLVTPGEYEYTIIKDKYDIYQGTITVVDEDVTIYANLGSRNYDAIFSVYFCNNPVEGAIFEINDELQTTDTEGNAYFSLKNGNYIFTMTLEGHGGSSGTFEIENADFHCAITSSLSLLTFFVYDNDAPVEGAIIEINNKTLTTDSDGKTNIFIGSDTYEFSITHEDYQTFTDWVNIGLCENKELIINLETVSIENLQIADIYIYPNPFNDIVHIKENTSVIKLYISNMLGQKVKEINLDGKTSFSTKELPKGVYLFTFEKDGKTETIKMVKNKN